MSKADDRRAAQAARDAENQREIDARPLESVPAPVTNRRSWASHCSGWRLGVHEQSRANREAGIFKCRWCYQDFDPPTELERAQRAAQATVAPPRQHAPRGWHT